MTAPHVHGKGRTAATAETIHMISSGGTLLRSRTDSPPWREKPVCSRLLLQLVISSSNCMAQQARQWPWSPALPLPDAAAAGAEPLCAMVGGEQAARGSRDCGGSCAAAAGTAAGPLRQLAQIRPQLLRAATLGDPAALPP